MYKYTECGLPNIVLQNGYTTIETKHGKSVSVENVKDLHRVIGKSIANKDGRLTGAEFRFLRIELDISQKFLGRLFGKSDQAVATWEKGKSEIPQLEEAVIRTLYLQSLDEDGKLKELLDTIVELDNDLDGRDELIFCETDEGWSECDKIAA